MKNKFLSIGFTFVFAFVFPFITMAASPAETKIELKNGAGLTQLLEQISANAASLKNQEVEVDCMAGKFVGQIVRMTDQMLELKKSTGMTIVSGPNAGKKSSVHTFIPLSQIVAVEIETRD